MTTETATQLKPAETGWLVELKNERPVWWSLAVDEEPGWTTDSLKALRFARKEDAEAYIEDTGWTDAFASEHEWVGPRVARRPSVASAPVEPAMYQQRHRVNGGKWSDWYTSDKNAYAETVGGHTRSRRGVEYQVRALADVSALATQEGTKP